MTEELSADLALADAEARESRERERFEAWFEARYPNREDRQSEFRMTSVRALMLEAYRAALAPAVPPGFVLVPVEPTNAMWDAAVLEENRISRDFPGQHPSCFQIWKAMVSAASSVTPTAPNALVGESVKHAASCRGWAAKTFNDTPTTGLCVGAGDRLIYAAQLLDALALAAAPSAKEPTCPKN